MRYNFRQQEEYAYMNPVALIRQKSKFIQKSQEQSKIRRLSDLQWNYVITAANTMAEQKPIIHKRTLFIMSALYAMYLRISELAASSRWTAYSNQFDHQFQFYSSTDSNNIRALIPILFGHKSKRINVGLNEFDSTFFSYFFHHKPALQML